MQKGTGGHFEGRPVPFELWTGIRKWLEKDGPGEKIYDFGGDHHEKLEWKNFCPGSILPEMDVAHGPAICGSGEYRGCFRADKGNC